MIMAMSSEARRAGRLVERLLVDIGRNLGRCKLRNADQ